VTRQGHREAPHRRGYEFVKGARYLVFAGARGSRLTTALCSGNMLLSAGDQPLRLSDEAQGMESLAPELIAALRPLGLEQACRHQAVPPFAGGHHAAA